MADNDIYNSKAKYEGFKAALEDFAKEPKDRKHRDKRRTGKYYCKNKANLTYFKKLMARFDARDLSYVRRLRLLNTLKIVCYATEKDLKDCDRDDIDSIMAFMHSVNKSIKTKKDFIIDIKHIWKILFPETDDKGRIDDDLTPYPVRHLKAKDIDISKEKRKDDRLDIDELEKLIKVFNQDIRIQAYLALAFESLGRPQELLYLKVKNIKLKDNYALIDISEHGKEGTKILQCIDSFPYVAEWYNKHPLNENPEAFFFINLGNTGRYEQLKPVTINKHLRTKMRLLGIKKSVTCYSLKRSGVTFRRLRGDSDLSIQHAAGWVSTKQLRTYDKSQISESFKIELAKRGLIDDEKYKRFQATTKKCAFCETINKLSDEICSNCKRPLDRKKIVAEIEDRDNKINAMETKMETMQMQFRKIELFEKLLVKKGIDIEKMIKV